MKNSFIREMTFVTMALAASAIVLAARDAVATTVMNLDDSGPGSVRAAVAATATGGVVDFSPRLTSTISLTRPIEFTLGADDFGK
jgi:hypothetical protein